MRKRAIVVLFLLGLSLSLTGCLPGDGSNYVGHAAGLFSGIWHGWIAPVSLIVSLFKKNIHIYEIYNNGFLYDLGFYMAVISGFGGLALSRHKAKRRGNSNELS